MYENYARIFTIFSIALLFGARADVYLGERGERIRGGDEPQLVSYRVLEGVTEPFESLRPDGDIPTWKLMKAAADSKAAGRKSLAALHEYGQILKNPYIFGEMPNEERYDIFLSMSKLLKGLGFYQKAELLLFEALTYSHEPHEAHLQLGLLLLDQENLVKTKVHLKNCLYYRENDVGIMIHLAVILIAESKVHEAQFYITRILLSLEERVARISSLLGKSGGNQGQLGSGGSGGRSGELTQWLEDVFVKVFHGEFRLVPSQYPRFFEHCAQLYDWLTEGELMGRFLFDLGQSLHEGGRPIVGKLMMRRGVETGDALTEGAVSMAIVRTRTAIDFPVVASSAFELIDALVSSERFLRQDHEKIELENSMDIYWTVPLVALSGFPTAKLSLRIMDLFHSPPLRADWHSQIWIQDANVAYPRPSSTAAATSGLLSSFFSTPFDGTSEGAHGIRDSNNSPEDHRVTIGILGGHLNNHAVGAAVLHALLTLDLTRFQITLLALPLRPDAVTSKIAALVHEIINIPMDLKEVDKMLSHLHLDILIFPDLQPFPDQQALFFRAQRLAPVQLCLYVLGGGCSSYSIDYYVVPKEVMPLSAVQAWHFHEQVVRVDWPILTTRAVQEMTDMVKGVGENIGDRRLRKEKKKRGQQSQREYGNDEGKADHELEGNIFFEGQPVAVLPVDPSLVHPLMDDSLLKLLQAIPNLQLLVIVREGFHAHVQSTRHRMAWARMLVRRLWKRGGHLQQRIRLLSSIVSDERFMSLVTRADVVLDSFPFGGSLHANALALGVGTPVVTIKAGVVLSTPRQDLAEILSRLSAASATADNAAQNALAMTKNDVPWVPTMGGGSLAGYYSRVSETLPELLVANNSSDYARLAAAICTSSELAYDIRVKLLDALDQHVMARTMGRSGAGDSGSSDSSSRWTHRDGSSSSSGGTTTTSATAGLQKSDTDDLEAILEVLGRPWAELRQKRGLESAPEGWKILSKTHGVAGNGSPTPKPDLPQTETVASHSREDPNLQGGRIEESHGRKSTFVADAAAALRVKNKHVDREEVHRRSTTTI